MIGYIAKAVTAFIVVLVALLLGDEAASGIDVTALDAAIVAAIGSIGVYAVPNRGGPTRRVP